MLNKLIINLIAFRYKEFIIEQIKEANILFHGKSDLVKIRFILQDLLYESKMLNWFNENLPLNLDSELRWLISQAISKVATNKK